MRCNAIVDKLRARVSGEVEETLTLCLLASRAEGLHSSNACLGGNGLEGRKVYQGGATFRLELEA